jgi:hypothetical protein
MQYVLAFLILLLPFQASAKNPIPEGEYVIVDEILTEGMATQSIVPTYILVTSKADTLTFGFMTLFRPRVSGCKKWEPCVRPVKALELRVSEKDGRISVLGFQVQLDEVISSPEADYAYTIEPTRLFMDGAYVVMGEIASIPGGVTLHRDNGTKARMVPVSQRFVEDSLDLVAHMPYSFGVYKKCLIRQMAKMGARKDLNSKEKQFLKFIALAGKTARLSQQNEKQYGIERANVKGSPEWRSKMIEALLYQVWSGSKVAKNSTLEQALVNKAMKEELGSEYTSLFEEAFSGNETDTLAASVWLNTINSMSEETERSGDKKRFVKRICEDITLAQ